jgi:acyl-CoA thioester hydrolase
VPERVEQAEPPFTFAMQARVRWSEVDPQGVVFNPNYLVYADIALTEYMRAIGLPFPDALEGSGNEFFAVRSEVDFRSPARFDDVLTLSARTARIGRTSFTVAFTIRRGEALLAEVRTVYVHADPKTATSVPLPERLIERIAKFEQTPPGRAA